jgi:hypothetical protein
VLLSQPSDVIPQDLQEIVNCSLNLIFDNKWKLGEVKTTVEILFLGRYDAAACRSYYFHENKRKTSCFENKNLFLWFNVNGMCVFFVGK